MAYKTGHIIWSDLTVPNLPQVKQFYEAVVGWSPEEFEGDYNMQADGETVAGICHQRGSNAYIPSQWIIYIAVPDVEAAVSAALANGGEIVTRHVSGVVFIKDPAGAYFAVIAEDASAE